MVAELIECEVVPSLSRAEIKDKARLLYISGRKTLVQLSAEFAIPPDTMNRWAKEGSWGESKTLASSQADQIVTSKVAERLAKEREMQVSAVIEDVNLGREAVRDALSEPDLERKLLKAKAVQSIATASEKYGAMARIALGMGDGSGPTLNLNVLGTVNIGE